MPTVSKSLLKSTEKRSIDELFADVRGKVKILEDLTKPTTDEWPQIAPAARRPLPIRPTCR